MEAYPALLEEVRVAMCAAEHSWSFTWAATAARLRRICDDLTQRALVDCA